MNKKSFIYKCILLILAPTLILYTIGTAAAGFKKAKSKTASSSEMPQSAYNPYPDDLDIELPMPGGGKMVFRPVRVMAKSFFSDMSTDFGCTECVTVGQEFSDNRYRVNLSAPFSLDDAPFVTVDKTKTTAPPSWKKRILKAEMSKSKGQKSNSYGLYYFIGKYEVTRAQWQAIMNPEDNSFGPDSSKPITDISWFDSVDFSRRYTEWLLENHPEDMPQFMKEVAYLRLPTEAEWEYAAIGGHEVSSTALGTIDFIAEEGRSVGDYAVFNKNKIADIGTKLPNRLLMYDTAGNASEMMLESFRFSVGGRLLGGAGGFIAKGGTYNSAEDDEVMPGRRIEYNYYYKGEKDQGKSRYRPFRLKTLGFRLVLSTQLTPGDRRDVLNKQWRKVGTRASVASAETALSEIERLLSGSERSYSKKDLTVLRDLIKNNSAALEREKAKSAGGVIRSAVFIAENIINYHRRIGYMKDLVEKLKDVRKTINKEQDILMVDDAIKRYSASISNFLALIDESSLFYIDRVKASTDFNKDLFDEQIEAYSRELLEVQSLARNSLKQNLDVYIDQVKDYRKGGGSPLTTKNVFDAILIKNPK
ncbi:MAG: SUMF1/EgtB/PvdO family nonheme iron enzyme [Pseudomonadota bacterium]